MIKKLNNTDYLFISSLVVGALLLSIFLFLYPYVDDEAFYATIPYRIINGDSLIQHEWHLSQFSSIFTYLPVRIWVVLKGSTEGMIFFLRCVYALIHTTVTVIIYRFFRDYGKWAITAAMLFFTLTTYRIIAISYNSMFVIFTLLLSLCLILIYKNSSIRLYVLAGVCFGCCCICNPLFSVAFALYLITCALWLKREILRDVIIKIKTWYALNKEKKYKRKQKRKKKNFDAFPNMENYNCFFNKKAIIFFSLGVLIVAVVAVVFFFSTGGTVSSIFKNINNLLASSEYGVFSSSVFSKIEETWYYFSKISFGMPYLLPMMYIILLFDKKRKKTAHRTAYLSLSLFFAIMYMVGILLNITEGTCVFSLPFTIVSTVCYILTHNKNKILFKCMWIPCFIALLFQYLASNTHLSSIGAVLVTNNVAGVLFARDLFNEMICESKPTKKRSIEVNNKVFAMGRCLICAGICFQFFFNGVAFQYNQLPIKDAVKVTVGPYAGMYLTQEQYSRYTKKIEDLDLIIAKSSEDTPILIASKNNWMYMYIERPFAIYTTWFKYNFNREQLTAYYKENPDKIPGYIYIDQLDDDNNYTMQYNIIIANELFVCTQEELPNGVLLTVEQCKF